MPRRKDNEIYKYKLKSGKVKMDLKRILELIQKPVRQLSHLARALTATKKRKQLRPN